MDEMNDLKYYIAKKMSRKEKKRLFKDFSSDESGSSSSDELSSLEDVTGTIKWMKISCSEQEAFDHIYNTELNHRGSWKNARTTYIVSTVNGDSLTITKNDPPHAEEKLVPRLVKNYDAIKKPMQVKMFMNNSPCNKCALILLDFLDEHWQARITIYFSSLYMIRRQSCTSRAEKHILCIPNEESAKNEDGLRKLMDHKRCYLQPFDQKAWKDLLRILNIPFSDFQQKYTTLGPGQDRNREKEDELLQEDLVFIDQQTLWKEKIFHQLFHLKPELNFVFSVNKCIFNSTVTEEGVMEDFFYELKKAYCSNNDSKMHVDVYMPLDICDCRSLIVMLGNFLWNHRQASIHIYTSKLDESTLDVSISLGIRKLMNHKRCDIKAFELCTWKSLLNDLGLQRPHLEEEYTEKNGCHRSRSEEDTCIRNILDDICYKDLNTNALVHL